MCYKWVYKQFGYAVRYNTYKYSDPFLARVNLMHNVGRSVD